VRFLCGNEITMNNTCVAFGSFDGVHTGHQAVIKKLLETSKQGLTSVILSLEYDESLLNGRKLLSTEEEKQHLLGGYGLEVMISYKVDHQNEYIPLEYFISQVLVGRLGAKAIIAGKCSSGIDVLRECQEKYGYVLVECDTVMADSEPVTAERIAEELSLCNLNKANELLGHPYLIIGKVMHGKALGRTVGMPTANIGFNQAKLLPSFGVYGTLSEIDGRGVKGLTNIGQRPSVDNYNYVTIETFLLDYSGDLYDKTITLEIHVYIRGVIKFKNLDEVKSQVNMDMESIRYYLDKVV